MNRPHFARDAALADLMGVADRYDIAQAAFKEAQDALTKSILDTYKVGASQQEIADVVHITRQRVSQILQENHVTSEAPNFTEGIR